MEVVGSEIGQKMRSAIKAKLTELGCYVDDELPDYVMVMVANKRTRAQMEEDLQLFLSDNTQLFVNWLHQVLKKLQEVTITPLKAAELEKPNEKTKEKKVKTKKVKDKIKKTDSKKAKKKDKDKSRKKEEKKAHKKKKSKKHEMIRPNVPPLLMNMEKESEPSITDVFAGQILKNHGITLDIPVLPIQKEEKTETKPVIEKRPILPIIDPATILSQQEEPSSQPEVPSLPTESQTNVSNVDKSPPNELIETPSLEAPKEDQIREMNEIEAKIQGLKQKLTEQLDSMSEDEDFLNIRTEAEELMNDFAEDVFQEISSQAPSEPQIPPKDPTPPPKSIHTPEGTPKDIPSRVPIDTTKELPETIELKLPKRPVRERLGQKHDAREEAVKLLEKTKLQEKRTSPERFTPEPEPDFWGKSKPSARSRLSSQPDRKKSSFSSDSDESEKGKGRKRITSTSSERTRSEREERGSRVKCASVVVVKPRMRAQTSSLLLRAMADAHKSLINIPPPKVDMEPAKVKRALVRPMRRVDSQSVGVRLSRERDRQTESAGGDSEHDKPDRARLESDKPAAAEYVPAPLSLRFGLGSDYVPSRRDLPHRLGAPVGDPPLDSSTIHNSTVGKDKSTQFIVTMDGFNPNAFLEKKLKNEGLLEGDKPQTTSVLKIIHRDKNENEEVTKDMETEEKDKHESVGKNDDANNDESVTKITESNENKDSSKKLETLKNLDNSPEPSEKSESNKDKDVIVKKTKDKNVGGENLESNKNNEIPQEKIEHKTRTETEGKKKANKNKDTSPQRTYHESRIEREGNNKHSEIEKETKHNKHTESYSKSVQNKRLSVTSEDSEYSDTQVIIKKDKFTEDAEKRKQDFETQESPPEKKRKASPIVFDMGIKERERKKERERERQREEERKEKEKEMKRVRTESASSDNNVIVTTAVNKNKYDTIPPLSVAERKTLWCRAFPACRYGVGCAFVHPRCKFAASCTRRNCPYSHDIVPKLPPVVPTPVVASHVVPVANYKTITPGVLPSICKFYPNCTNAACRFYHPKPCHFGPNCANKLECNFYHA